MPTERTGFQDYDSCNQSNEYRTVGGVVQLPVAGRTSAHKLIRLHGGYGTRVVKWRANRYGRPPVIPRAQDTTGDTLLGSTVTPQLPRPNEYAGGFDWSVSGEYVYAQNTVRTPGTDTLPVGNYPFVLPTQERMATALAGQTQESPSPSNFNAYFSSLGEALYDPTTGSYVWPFLALPPAFSSGDLI